MLGELGVRGLAKIPTSKLSINQPMNLEIKLHFFNYMYYLAEADLGLLKDPR